MESLFKDYKLTSQITGEEIAKWAAKLDLEPKDDKLSDENVKILCNLLFSESEIEKGKLDELFDSKSKNCLFLAVVFKKRVETLHTFKCSKAVMILFGFICNSPGEVVMYTNYLQYVSHDEHKSEFKLKDICVLFPYRFYDQTLLQRYWDLQKVHFDDSRVPDNMLDYSAAMVSLQ